MYIPFLPFSSPSLRGLQLTQYAYHIPEERMSECPTTPLSLELTYGMHEERRERRDETYLVVLSVVVEETHKDTSRD